MFSNIKVIATCVIFSIIIILLIVVGLLWHSSTVANNQVGALEQSNVLLQKASSIQTDTSNAFNSISGDTYETNNTADVHGEARRVEIRTVYKTVRIANECLPDAVTNSLLSNAYRLRSAAMHADQSNTDSANTNPAAGTCLTYENAVVWIDQLLTALEKANNDKAGIRQEVAQQQKIYKTASDSK